MKEITTEKIPIKMWLENIDTTCSWIMVVVYLVNELNKKTN